MGESPLGTAVRGPVCTVVWESGGGNPPGDPIRHFRVHGCGVILRFAMTP
jgi:hypothetical protein